MFLLFHFCNCRYGLFDFEYMHQCQGTSESSKKQKLFLMSWCPDTAKVIININKYLLFLVFFFFFVGSLSILRFDDDNVFVLYTNSIVFVIL